MLEKVQFRLEHLSRSERRVAEIILASPDNTIHSNVAALALEASVSEPTVNRFCRNMGTRGFPDFKLRLTQGLANGTSYVSRNINEGDNVELYTGKISESATTTFDHIRYSLDKSVISRTVDLLTQTKKTASFGLGSSTAVVYDAMNKFLRFDIPVMYFDDVVLQRMGCMSCSDGNAVMLVSRTGETKSLVELVQLARENDAMVIALTSAGTPFTREATLTITLDVPEDTGIYTLMVSQLAQLTVIDALATGFTSRRGTEFRDSLKRVRGALREPCFDKQLPNLNDDR